VSKSAEEFMTDAQLRAYERTNMIKALNLANWRVSGPEGAAQMLGLKPTTFTDRMKKFAIERPRRQRA
jgi:transcriptional regulator with GAF, ATPase, and Fis domain